MYFYSFGEGCENIKSHRFSGPEMTRPTAFDVVLASACEGPHRFPNKSLAAVSNKLDANYLRLGLPRTRLD